MERIAILGASRGLGRALTQTLQEEFLESRLFLSSRKLDQLQALTRPHDSVFTADFTRDESQLQLFEALLSFRPDRLFYVAGGGPYGPFDKKSWTSHEWAFRLNLLFPARLLHFCLDRWEPLGIRQVVVVGSSVAESQADPLAASYSAAKHGLLGLVRNLKQEYPDRDVRLFSPGYMETDLLPQGSWPREKGLAEDPKDVAKRLWQEASSSLDCRSF